VHENHHHWTIFAADRAESSAKPSQARFDNKFAALCGEPAGNG
jgi:hypothetical protein